MKNDLMSDFKSTILNSLFVLLPIPFIAVPLVLFKIDTDYIMTVTVLASIVLMSKDLWITTPKAVKSKSRSFEDKYDVFFRSFDNFALGAITTHVDDSDLLSSSDLAKRAAKIYADARK